MDFATRYIYVCVREWEKPLGQTQPQPMAHHSHVHLPVLL